MSEEIKSWRVLREDGKNIAWVNSQFIGVVSNEQVLYFEKVCPTNSAPDAGRAEVSSGRVTPPAQVS